MNFKHILFCACICSSNFLWGQTTSYSFTKEKIDSIVSKTDSILSVKYRVFNLKKQYKTYTEKWTYLRDSKYLLFFRINYTIDSTDYEEEYYLYKGELILANEKEVSRFPSMNPVDSIGWSGVFYFSGHKLLYQSTLGHGKSERGDWDPKNEARLRFSKRTYQRPELLTWSK